jgi:hypothetical protein
MFSFYLVDTGGSECLMFWGATGRLIAGRKEVPGNRLPQELVSPGTGKCKF